MALQVLLVLTSLLLIPLVLLHKGKGGGLSDMFGGGISSSAGSSGVAERNLNRITVGTALLWTVIIILLGLLERTVGGVGDGERKCDEGVASRRRSHGRGGARRHRSPD